MSKTGNGVKKSLHDLSFLAYTPVRLNFFVSVSISVSDVNICSLVHYPLTLLVAFQIQ